MYCPKCGQQVSGNVRFCSRCGLAVSEVAEWLSGGAQLSVREAPQELLSPKRKGMRRGAKIMFWAVALTPILLGLSIAIDAPFPILIPVIIFFAGLVQLLYSRLFGEEIPQPEAARLETAQENAALPHGPLAAGITGGGRQSRTAEMVSPPSVTEQTTRLLDGD